MLDSLTLSSERRASLQAAAETYAKYVDDLASYLMARGVTKQAAHSSLLGKVCDPMPGHERFEGMLSIPYVTLGGVVAFKFRNTEHDKISNNGQKYDSPAGQHGRLYNVAALQSDLDVIAICEGELCALIFETQTGIPAVGTPGTSWQEHWSRCFADFDRVLVVADHDVREDGSSPGVKHAKAVASKVRGAVLVLPPAGEDPDSWVLRDGVEAVRARCGV